MRSRHAIFILACTLGAGAFWAAAGRADPVPYAIGEGSSFEYGCYDPCMCPIFVVDRFGGGFTLEPIGNNGLYDLYAVRDVRWKLFDGAKDVRVSGSGTYRIGGEFALQHQLSLDLVVDDHPPQHFDSGLQVGGSEFPGIRIGIAVHGFFCFDSAFVVDASPAPLDAPDPLATRFGITRVAPNPTGGAASVEFMLPVAARVELAIFDPAGRRIRTLAAAQPFAAGAQRAEWDGTRDDGALARPGLYFARLSSDGRRDVRAIVRR